MRKSKKSVHVEAIALSLFIVALVGYASFFTVGNTNVLAQTNIDAGGNAKCAKEKEKGDQMPEKTPEEKQKKKEFQDRYKKEATKIPCGTGKCIAFCEQGICRGDGGNPGCPKASDDGKKKAEDAMKKKEEPKGEGKGGGEPPKMPEIPKKEPKKEEPKQEQKPCPTQQPIFGQGEQTTVSAANSPSGQQQLDQYGRPCTPENAPANFLSQLRDNLLKAFSETFTPLTSSDLEGLTPEEQLQKISELINGNPTLDDKPGRIEATNSLVNAYEEAGFQGTVEQAVAHANTMTVDDINNAANNVSDDMQALQELAQSQSADLVPTTGGSNPESSTNIITSVSNWLTSWWPF